MRGPTLSTLALLSLFASSGCGVGEGIADVTTVVFEGVAEALGCALLSGDGPARAGELGVREMELASLCVGTCSLEAPLATGSSFEVRISGFPDGITLSSSNPEVVAVDDARVEPATDCTDSAFMARLVAVSEGETTLEVRSAGAVVDRFAFRVQSPSTRAIAVYALDALTEDGFEATRVTEVDAGSTHVARVEALGVDGTELLFDAPATWTATSSGGEVEADELGALFFFTAPEEPGTLELTANLSFEEVTTSIAVNAAP